MPDYDDIEFPDTAFIKINKMSKVSDWWWSEVKSQECSGHTISIKKYEPPYTINTLSYNSIANHDVY